MARLDWDRLRRIQPLDGADARIDPDGAVLWEREVGPEPGRSPPRDRLDAPNGVQRLRAGIVVRRTRARFEAELADAPPREDAPRPLQQPRAALPFDASAWIECPRCKERVPRRKLLLHARAACARRA